MSLLKDSASKAAREIEYACQPKNSFVIRYGEAGDLFYIILRGRVSVWVPMSFQQMQRPIKKFRTHIRGNKFERSKDFLIPKSLLD